VLVVDALVSHQICAVSPPGEDKEALITCYKNVLLLVTQHKFKSVAFATRVDRYPSAKAVNVALSTVRFVTNLSPLHLQLCEGHSRLFASSDTEMS